MFFPRVAYSELHMMNIGGLYELIMISSRKVKVISTNGRFLIKKYLNKNSLKDTKLNHPGPCITAFDTVMDQGSWYLTEMHGTCYGGSGRTGLKQTFWAAFMFSFTVPPGDFKLLGFLKLLLLS